MLFFVIGSIGLISQGCAPNKTSLKDYDTIASASKIKLDKSILDACLVCHSTKEMQRGPVLDGFPSWYLEIQLKKFQLGYRGKNPDNRAEQLMWTAMSKITTKSEITALSDYFSRQKPKPSLRVIRGNVDKGKILYDLRCASCHGLRGKGKREINSPPLNVQEDWFLMDQLRKYATGQRGIHPEDIDGVIMKNSTVNLSVKDLQDIVAYISKNLTVAPALQKVGPAKK